MNLNEVTNVIFEIRGIPVMLDIQAAYIYQSSLPELHSIVKRNLNRLPDDFMFTLTADEIKELVAQKVVSADIYTGEAYAFSEQGIAMLSVLLNTHKAVLVSHDIMRTYSEHTEWLKEDKKATEEIKEHIKSLDLKYNEAFQFLLNKIQGTDGGAAPEAERPPIGFKFKRG